MILLGDEEIARALYDTEPSRSVARRITVQDEERFNTIARAQLKKVVGLFAQEPSGADGYYLISKKVIEALLKEIE